MKKIYPISAAKILIITIFMVFLTLGISLFIIIFVEKFEIYNNLLINIFGIIIAILLIIFSIYASYTELKKCIRFKDDELYVASDGTVFGFMIRIQYETLVKYTEITDI